MQAQNETLKKNLAESQNEKSGLKARVAELGQSLHHYRSRNTEIELKSSLNKIEKMKGRIEELEVALHSCELRIELLETREERWEEELHHSHDQIRNRDYLMGEAITLAVEADILSMKYELQSGRSQELISLHGKIRTLGLKREKEREKENLETEHHYGTRAKTKKMDQRFEQFQKDLQDQM
ncbi:vimentin-like [Gossypium australe]|uniref:Vimentin-like n=1 Tax=Gossypium australe TaxID=47621 RepID=A0A5B6VDG1_9ROSI|nr:vimentin-like [Gossypium australe]